MKTINHECYVSLEVAKLLKEAGFDWKVEFFYQDGILINVLPDELFNGDFENLEYYYKHIGIPHYSLNCNGGISKFLENCSAPTLDVAQRWLREAKGFMVETTFITDEYSVIYQANLYEVVSENSSEGFSELISVVKGQSELKRTYEEAQEAGIKKALELILEKGE